MLACCFRRPGGSAPVQWGSDGAGDEDERRTPQTPGRLSTPASSGRATGGEPGSSFWRQGADAGVGAGRAEDGGEGDAAEGDVAPLLETLPLALLESVLSLLAVSGRRVTAWDDAAGH